MMTLFKNYNFPTIAKSIHMMGKRYKLFLTCTFIFCAVSFISVPLRTFGIKGVINAAGSNEIKLFWHSLTLILLANILWWIIAPVSSYLCAFSSKEAMCEIKTNLFGHIVKLPQIILDKRTTGDLLSVLSNDSACLQNIYDRSFFQVLSSASYGLTGIVMMVVIDWRFALVVLVLGSASVITASYFSKKVEKSGKAIQEQLAKSSTGAYEIIKAAKTIRLLKLMEYESHQIADSTAIEAEAKISSGKVITKMNTIMVGIKSLSYLAILSVGALFVYYELSDWGTVIALTALKDAADDLFIKCVQFLSEMQKNIAGVKRIIEIDKIKEEVLADEKHFFFKQNNVPIELQNICFAYSENKPVLKNVNIKIDYPGLIILTGESGCGKSTVMKLIMALYQPSDGKIIINGSDKPTLTALRNKTAYVPQEPMLFRGSIYENIACGNEQCSYDDVIAAAKQAEADVFITASEKGYDTMLSDNGNCLSGGQKQRIALARALVKNAPVLLLDEITSSLDKDNEEQIMRTIKKISRSRSILMITHKTEIGKISDQVISM
jgi:ATP-binding cassette, subfamily B, bacterial